MLTDGATSRPTFMEDSVEESVTEDLNNTNETLILTNNVFIQLFEHVIPVAGNHIKSEHAWPLVYSYTYVHVDS